MNKYFADIHYILLKWFRTKLGYFTSSSVMFLILMIFQGCASVFSDLQSAKLVEKDEFEITPSFSSIYYYDENDSGHIENHYGLQVAYGLAENINYRLRYERINLDTNGSKSFGFNAVGFGPKIGIKKDVAAFHFPIGFAYGNDIKTSKSWQFHPTLLYTLSSGIKFELNTSLKALIPLNNDNDTLIAFNIGSGISSNLNKWAIRPEIGFLINPGEEGHFNHYSIGLTLYP